MKNYKKLKPYSKDEPKEFKGNFEMKFKERCRRTPTFRVSEDVFLKLIKHSICPVEVTDWEKEVPSQATTDMFVYSPNGIEKRAYLPIGQYLFDVTKDPDIKKALEGRMGKPAIAILDQSFDKKAIEKDIKGDRAWWWMVNLLNRHYTNAEIKEKLLSYKTPYDPEKIQKHVNWLAVPNQILEIGNCVEYDINSAYVSILANMFPKSKEDLEYQYTLRKEYPVIKKYFNYFTGMVKNKGFDGAYNFIVQECRRKLEMGIKWVGGYLIYANTDGFVVAEPERPLETQPWLGGWKEEFKGTIRTFQMVKPKSNYLIAEFDNGVKKGSCPVSARGNVNLFENMVTEFESEMSASDSGAPLRFVKGITQTKAKLCDWADWHELAGDRLLN